MATGAAKDTFLLRQLLRRARRSPDAVCLDDRVTVDLSKHYPLTPDRVLIVRDVALDDTAAANLALQCRLKVF